MIFIYLFTYLFCFLGLHLRHREVLRLEVQSELQLPAYATATGARDVSRVFDSTTSSQPRQILNPPIEASD